MIATKLKMGDEIRVISPSRSLCVKEEKMVFLICNRSNETYSFVISSNY